MILMAAPPLHVAARFNAIDCMKVGGTRDGGREGARALLVSCHVVLNCAPSLVCTISPYCLFTKVLLRRGADKTLADGMGKIALDYTKAPSETQDLLLGRSSIHRLNDDLDFDCCFPPTRDVRGG